MEDLWLSFSSYSSFLSLTSNRESGNQQIPLVPKAYSLKKLFSLASGKGGMSQEGTKPGRYPVPRIFPLSDTNQPHEMFSKCYEFKVGSRAMERDPVYRF